MPGVLAILIVGYLLLVGMSLFIGGDLLLQGEISKGISVLLYSVIIAVCVYVWLIRGWIKHIKQMKNIKQMKIGNYLRCNIVALGAARRRRGQRENAAAGSSGDPPRERAKALSY